MIQETTAAGSELFKFESMEDVKAYTDVSRFKDRGASFVGEEIGTWYDVDLKTTQPWKKGAEILEKYIARLGEAALPTLKSRVRKTEWSFDDGDEIDTGRMMQGLPYRRRMIREETGGPAEMTILIDTTTPYYEESDNILWRGAAAVALTHILEEKGYRVELWVCNGSKLFAYENTNVLTAACLKRTSDPLDTSTLINTVSGWFYRSATFTLLETICTKSGKQIANGLGQCASPMPKDLDSISRDELRVYSSGVYSFQGALEMIVAEVNRVMAATEANANA